MFIFYIMYIAELLLSVSCYNRINFHTFKPRIIIKYFK
jgi:hypothetical protein